MRDQTTQGTRIWALVREQHGVVARCQLLELGLTPKAIKHRVTHGRLHQQYAGVYSVGRPELTQHGRWMAAVLACGPGAWLSHESAAALYRVARTHAGAIQVSVRAPRDPHHEGIRVHRRRNLGAADLDEHDGIPVTSIACTLADLAGRHGADYVEAAVNEADKLDLIDPERLRATLAEMEPRRPGVASLRRTLDRHTFTMSDSELERRFKPIAREVGLRLTPDNVQQPVNGFRVDFYWPELGLVIETDGQRYHRTPAQQTKDRKRDQAHAAAGLTPLRFTRWQVRFDRRHVEEILEAVVERLRAVQPSGGNSTSGED